MPVPNRKKIVCAVTQSLARIPDSELLPMPHSHSSTKIRFQEREEYHQRQDRYQQAFPKYEEGFGRLTTATVDAVWKVLQIC